MIRKVYHIPSRILQWMQMLQLRIKGVEYGVGIQLIGLTRWYIRGKVVIGDYFVSSSNQKHSIDNHVCSKVSVAPNAVLRIGNHVGMTNTSIQCEKCIEIGDYTIIGGGTMIMDSDFHDLSWGARRSNDTGCATATKAPIRIHEDCFVGTNCIVCKGIEIGPRSIVAAGSVIVKDVPADEIWGGNPARFIRRMDKRN